MSKNQKIWAGILGAIVIILIIISINRDGESPRTKTSSKINTASSSVKITDSTLVLPETGDQTIELTGGQGSYTTNPGSTNSSGKVSVSDKMLEKGSDVVSVVYQDPGGNSTYAWLVLFVKDENTYSQNSNLFLGENVLVNDIKAVDGDGGYTVLVDMTSTIAPTGSSTVSTTQNSTLSVLVSGSKFNQLTAQIVK